MQEHCKNILYILGLKELSFYNYKRYKDINLDRTYPACLCGAAKAYQIKNRQHFLVNLKFFAVND